MASQKPIAVDQSLQKADEELAAKKKLTLFVRSNNHES